MTYGYVLACYLFVLWFRDGGRQACRLECQARQQTDIFRLACLSSLIFRTWINRPRFTVSCWCQRQFGCCHKIWSSLPIDVIIDVSNACFLISSGSCAPSTTPPYKPRGLGSDFWHGGRFSWNVCCRWMCWHRSGYLGCGIKRAWLRRFQRSSWMEWWWKYSS